MFSLLSSSAAALTYEKAGKEFNGVSSIIKAVSFRILAFLFLVIILVAKICEPELYMIIISLSFIFLGRSWAYLYINMNSIVLKLERKTMSYTDLTSNIGNIFGIFLSSYLLSLVSYPIEILVSLSTMSILFILHHDKLKLESVITTLELNSSKY